MKKISYLMTAASIFLMASSMAMAYEWQVVSKVTLVQPGYMPNEVSFQLSGSAGSCPAGTWMRWVPTGTTEAQKIANANAVYSTLMTALVTGKDVRIYGVNDRCTVEFLHMF